MCWDAVWMICWNIPPKTKRNSKQNRAKKHLGEIRGANSEYLHIKQENEFYTMKVHSEQYKKYSSFGDAMNETLSDA